MTADRRPPTGAAVLRPELTDAVVEAVFDELAVVGYGRLSMQRVAARAGVGKSALYRRWPGKHDMVMDAIGRLGVPDRPPPDTGSLRDDVRALLEEMRSWLAHPRLRDILPDLLAEARRSPEFAASFRERLAAPRRRWGRAVLDRAIERGDVAADRADDLTVELMMDLVGSAPYWRTTVHGTDAGDEYLDRLATLLAGSIARDSAPLQQIARDPSTLDDQPG